MINRWSSVLKILGSLLGVILGSSLTSITVSSLSKRRSERRNLYAKGINYISQREELYYRILRRGTSEKKANDLIELMHSNQSQIYEHAAILSVDSYWLGESYNELVRKFRGRTEKKFRDAWSRPLVHRYDSVPQDRRIDCSDLLQDYALDCRRRLNPVRSVWNTLTRRFRNGRKKI